MFTREQIVEAKRVSLSRWDRIRKAKDEREADKIYDETICGFCLLFPGNCSSCVLSDKNIVCCKEFDKWATDMYNKKGNIRWARYWAEKLYLRIKNIDVDEALELANRKKDK